MAENDSPLVTSIIGGRRSVGGGFDIDMNEGSSDAEVSEADYDRIFDDLEESLGITNSFGAKILNSDRKFVVPSYQRYYSWEESNHEELWRTVEDILNRLKGASDGDDLPAAADQPDVELNESYFGPIYIAESTRQTEDSTEEIFEVIDGQQRLATVFLILNEIRKQVKEIEKDLREKKFTEDRNVPYSDGIEYLRKGIISSTIYNDSNNDGKSKFLHLELNNHDKEYFQTNFEDDTKSVLETLNEIKLGNKPYYKKVSNILKDLDIDPDEVDIDIEDVEVDVDSEDPEISDFLGEKLYFATKGSHNKIFTAREKYSELIEQYLSENLGLDETDYKNRAVALINIGIVVMTAFRIVEFKFDNSVDDSMKIDVFQSLNETGKPLTLTEKIRARVVNKFGIGDESVAKFEDIVHTFGEDSDTIQQYLLDYILATESETHYEKNEVKNNLLRFFSLRENSTSQYTSRLTQDEPDKFIEELRSHASKYKTIKDGGDIPADDIDDQEYRNECNNILADLPGKQWRPFALRLYIDLSRSSSFVSEKFFRDMLRNIENIMIRSSFATGAATAIDQTFIGACLDYNNKNIPDYDEVDAYEDRDEGWMEIDEFNEEPRKIIEAQLVKHSSWDTISGTSIARNMHGSEWGNSKEILQLLARRNMASLSSRPGAVSTKYTLDLTDTELEHVFPKTPKINDDDNRSPDTVANPLDWYNVFFELDSEDSGEYWPSIKEKFEDIDESGETNSADHDRLEDLSEHIIEDIGNHIILESQPNDALRNAQFSVKSLGYYLTRKGDLKMFADPIADPDWLDLSVEELACDAECLGLTLGQGEAQLLLYQLEKMFDSVDLAEISSMVERVPLDDTNKLNPGQFETEYESVEDMLTEFDLSREDYSSIYDDYADYEFNSDEGLLTDQDEDNNLSPSKLYDKIIINILIKIVSRRDVTEVPSDLDGECSFEGDYIVSRVNKKWNWERVVERKVEIIENLLEEVSMTTIDHEFTDLDTDYHYEHVLSDFRYR